MRFGVILLVLCIGLTDGQQKMGEIERENTCSNFFTIIPKGPQSRSLCESVSLHRPQLHFLSTQMTHFNSTLLVLSLSSNVFSFQRCLKKLGEENEENEEEEENLSVALFPHLHFLSVSSKDLFDEYQIPTKRMSNLTRQADIFKILFAHKYQLTYLDLEIHFLSNDLNDFKQTFVGFHIWNHMKCSQELTNVAFCLPSLALSDLINKTRKLLSCSTKKCPLPPNFGPFLFTTTLPNRHALSLFSLNHPQRSTLSAILEGYQEYHHKFLYLPLSFSPSLPYGDYVRSLRSHLSVSSLFSSRLSLSPVSPSSLFSPLSISSLSELLKTMSDVLEGLKGMMLLRKRIDREEQEHQQLEVFFERISTLLQHPLLLRQDESELEVRRDINQLKFILTEYLKMQRDAE